MGNQYNIRNFVIIAHIDHGKSTLADRLLELTHTIPKEKMKAQYLDMMDLERERGITIKMQPVRMLYEHPQNQKPKIIVSKTKVFEKLENQKENKELYILNLIDTPGHVDFSYEVSRSLAAVEGAILLVDATKGIQAQTIANLELAKKQNLVIIPAVNKIDSPQAKTEETKTELANLLNIKKEDVFLISAKYGANIEKLLQAVIEKIPCPHTKFGVGACPSNFVEGGFRALIFDSKYDLYKGVIACVRVFDGETKVGEKIYLLAAETEGEVKELGYFAPTLSSQKALRAGEIGYIATGIKTPGKVRVGDTIIKLKINDVEPLSGYKEPKPMVFASIYPEDQNDYDLLKDALSKLKLNDASLVFEPESREFLGRGFRSGFLGTLHAEIVSERLKREFGLSLVISTPSVLYKIINENAQEIFVKSASDWPQATQIKEIREPWARLEIITPAGYLGKTMEVLENIRGKYRETKYLSQERILLVYEVPLREIMSGFYAQLKSQTQGFASMNYEVLDWRPANLVKLEILIAGRKEEVLSKIVSRNLANLEGKKMVERLKEIVPSQLFSVALQAMVENQIIARETIKARRRDVIAPLYGGDYSRKRKLLERQKRGKKELKAKGVIRLPPDVFLKMFSQ